MNDSELSCILRGLVLCGVVCAAGVPLRLPAQVAVASAATVLSGTVTDPSGALVPQATLVMTAHAPAMAGTSQTVRSDAAGRFSVSLAPGEYDLAVTADGFNEAKRVVTVGARPLFVDLRLTVAATTDEINVPSNGAASTASGDNKSALVFRGQQLDTLSSNDTAMQQQVLAMAGGSGEGGGKVYVDGFSGGRFPPKDTIREIRINQNPFSSQYDDLGYGRVEVFTKPGSDKFHGSYGIQGNTKGLNSLNPYTGEEPPYYLVFNRGVFSGPLGKKTSFLLSGESNDAQGNVVVNAFNPDGSRLSEAVPAPQTSYTFGAHIDRQVNTTNTLVGRYEYSSTKVKNSGVGLLVLPSEGIDTSTEVQTLQVGNTQLIGANIVSETRFQYLRTRLGQTPVSTAPTIVVQGAFDGGGAPTQAAQDSQDQYEFQEYTSVSQGTHFVRAGVRYRLLHEVNTSTANYNGQFTFPTLAAYQAGVPSLFSLTTGQTTASLLTGDIGAYAEDEWKARKDLTITYGLRLESQNAIPDHFNPAPRAGISWAVRQTDKHPALFVLRANAGVFYSRFAAGNILTSIRQNGVSQQAFLLKNPEFYPAIPNPGELSGTPPTPYSISPHLRVASEWIASVGVERALGKEGKLGSVSLTYYGVRGVHQYNSENINAPIGGVRPLGGRGDIYRFASDGIEKAQSLSANANLQPTKQLSLFAYYGARRQTSDTFGAASFPSQPYRVSADYGPSGLGMQPIGQRLFADASYTLPFGFSADAFVAVLSRSRFNITTGTDRNEDTQFNDRPAFATNPGPTSVLYRTAYGTFDANPQPGEAIIPYNYAPGPRLLFTALDVGRDFKFGPRPEAPPTPAAALKPGEHAPRPDPAYDLDFSVEAINLLNHNNPGAPVGVLSSPFFGRSISTNSFFDFASSGNRFVFLHAGFRF